jgi:hypothetical protein
MRIMKALQFISLCLLTLGAMSNASAQDKVKEQSVLKKNAYVNPPLKAGDNGHMLHVKLTAPGKITSVDYKCEGEACGYVHECPDSGNCSGEDAVDRVKLNGKSADWYAWSNSGAPAVFHFTIHYE